MKLGHLSPPACVVLDASGPDISFARPTLASWIRFQIPCSNRRKGKRHRLRATGPSMILNTSSFPITSPPLLVLLRSRSSSPRNTCTPAVLRVPQSPSVPCFYYRSSSKAEPAGRSSARNHFPGPSAAVDRHLPSHRLMIKTQTVRSAQKKETDHSPKHGYTV